MRQLSKQPTASSRCANTPRALERADWTSENSTPPPRAGREAAAAIETSGTRTTTSGSDPITATAGPHARYRWADPSRRSLTSRRRVWIQRSRWRRSDGVGPCPARRAARSELSARCALAPALARLPFLEAAASRARESRRRSAAGSWMQKPALSVNFPSRASAFGRQHERRRGALGRDQPRKRASDRWSIRSRKRAPGRGARRAGRRNQKAHEDACSIDRVHMHRRSGCFALGSISSSGPRPTRRSRCRQRDREQRSRSKRESDRTSVLQGTRQVGEDVIVLCERPTVRDLIATCGSKGHAVGTASDDVVSRDGSGQIARSDGSFLR